MMRINLVIFKKGGHTHMREYPLMQKKSSTSEELKRIRSKVTRALWFRPKAEYTLELLPCDPDGNMIYRDSDIESFFKTVENLNLIFETTWRFR